MNFQPLFLTARVVTAIYRITSTTILLFYLGNKVIHKRRVNRVTRRLYD